MRYLLTCVTISVGLILLASGSYAQPTVRAFPANSASLDVFFLKDFDINRPGTGPTIFNVVINNDNTPRNVILELAIRSRRHDKTISSGRTNPFPLSQNQQLMLTNNDLFTNSGQYRFEDYRIDRELLDELLQDILATGRLPSDVYSFDVRLLENGSPIQGDNFEIRVSNPRRLDLLFPGTPASGRKEDCQRIFTNLPQFRWESDMRLFRVIVAEARPNEDPESILNQSPRFVRNFFIQKDLGVVPDNFDFADLDQRPQVLPSTAFQYPASGEILTLRPGHTYYWRVIGFIQSSSGLVPLESEIFCFRIPKLDQVSADAQQLRFILRNILGPDFEKLFSEGGPLHGYTPQRVTFGGEEVSLPEVLVRLQKMNRRFSGYRIE